MAASVHNDSTSSAQAPGLAASSPPLAVDLTTLTKTAWQALPIKTYEEVRDQLQTGDLLLTSGNYWISRLVRRITGRPYSHVAFVVRLAQYDRLFVVESVELYGVRFFRLSQYTPQGRYAGSRPYAGLVLLASWKSDFMDDAKRAQLAQVVMDQITCKYDYIEIVLNGLCLFFSKKNHRRRNQAYTCAELVDHVFDACGIHFAKNKQGIVTPGAIADHPQLQFLARIK